MIKPYWYYEDLEQFAVDAEDLCSGFEHMISLMNGDELDYKDDKIMREVAKELQSVVMKIDYLVAAGEDDNFERYRKSNNNNSLDSL